MLNWAGLQQLVAETARAGEQGGGKRAQALKNMPALVAAALAVRGLPGPAGVGGEEEGEGSVAGMGGTVERLRAAFNGAMARLGGSVEPGRLGVGVMEALGLLGQADVLLQELKDELGAGGGRAAAGETEGVADPAVLARFWRGLEEEIEDGGEGAAAAPVTPEPPSASLAGWLAGLGAREPVADAGALAAVLKGLGDGRFQEGKGPYRLRSGGPMLLRATHTALPGGGGGGGSGEAGPGRTWWVAEVVLGKARGPEAAAAGAVGVVPVLVRVVVEGNPASAWSRRAEEAAAAALLGWGRWLRERGGVAGADAVRTVAAVLEELRLTLRPGVCGLTGRALMLDGASGPLDIVTPYGRVELGGQQGGGRGRLVYPLMQAHV